MPRTPYLHALLLASVVGCARGSTLGNVGGAGGGGGQTAGPSGATTGFGGAGTTGNATTVGATTTNVGPSTVNTTAAIGPTTATVGPSTVATTGPSTVTTGTGVSSCDPENPAPACGPNMHCIPQSTGNPQCVPAGNGQDYSSCTLQTQCAPADVCGMGPTIPCCFHFCQVALSGADCLGPFDSCYALTTPVYVNGQQYGICWDGSSC